jgi:hypothetical protein
MSKLLISEINDPYIRDNFRRIEDILRSESLLKGSFKFFEIEIDGAVTNLKYSHNLGFVPKDVIQTSITGSGSLDWNFPNFTKDFLDITTTGPVTVRAFIGTYQES